MDGRIPSDSGSGCDTRIGHLEIGTAYGTVLICIYVVCRVKRGNLRQTFSQVPGTYTYLSQTTPVLYTVQSIPYKISQYSTQ